MGRTTSISWILDMVSGPQRERTQRKHSPGKGRRRPAKRQWNGVETLEPRLALSGVGNAGLDDGLALLSAEAGSSSEVAILKDSGKADDAYEPNDSPADAAAGTPAGTNSPNLGLLNGQKVIQHLVSDNTDWFLFEMLAAGDATSSVGISSATPPASSDLDLNVYPWTPPSTPGNRINADNVAGSSNETVSLNGAAAGYYMIEVLDAVGTNPDYTLTINPALPPDDSYEDNDTKTIVDGQAVGEGGNLGGLVDLPGDVSFLANNLKLLDTADVYRFVTYGPGTSDDYVRIDFLNGQGDLTLTLLDSSGTQVAQSATSNDNEQISLDTRAAGTYYVQVTGDGGVHNLAYALSIDAPVPMDDAYENNDTKAIVDGRTPGDANSPSLGVLVAPKTLSSMALMDDADWYKFSMNAAGDANTSVHLTYSGGGALDFAVQNAAGSAVGALTGSGGDRSFSLDGLSAGTYYVVLTGTLGALNPSYNLTITPAVPPDDSYEENDTPATAKVLDIHTGNFTPVTGLKLYDTADWYSITLPGAGTAANTARIEFDPVNGSPNLDLYDSTGTTVLASSALTEGYKEVPLAQAAGTYLLKVSGEASPDYSLYIYPPVSDDDAYEDNDSKDIVDHRTAGATGSPNLGGVYNTVTVSSLKLYDDEDWYRLVTSGPGALSVAINFTNADGNLELTLYDSNGTTELGTSAGTGNSETVGVSSVVSNHVYYAKVYGAIGDRNGNYSLVVTAPAPEDDAYEGPATGDNDAYARTNTMSVSTPDIPTSNLGLLIPADPLHPTTTVTGLKALDKDYYRFQMLGKGTATIRVDYNAGGAPLTMQIVRAGGLPAPSTTYTTGSTSVVATMTGTVDLSTPATYYVYVNNPTGINLDYSLAITPFVPQDDGYDLGAGNDTYDVSAPLGSLTAQTTYSNLKAYDEDWYTFSMPGTGQAAHKVEIQFSQTTGDLDLYLWRMTGTPATLTLVNSSATTNDGETISLAGLPGGTDYYVQVKSVNGAVNTYSMIVNPSNVTFNFDIDGNGKYEPFMDGILILRYLAGFRGTSLVKGAIGSGATRTKAEDIVAYLDAGLNNLDVDGNTKPETFMDGILILRYLAGFRGPALIKGAIGTGATRTTAPAIEAFLGQFTSSKGSAEEAPAPASKSADLKLAAAGMPYIAESTPVKLRSRALDRFFRDF